MFPKFFVKRNKVVEKPPLSQFHPNSCDGTVMEPLFSNLHKQICYLFTVCERFTSHYDATKLSLHSGGDFETPTGMKSCSPLKTNMTGWKIPNFQ